MKLVIVTLLLFFVSCKPYNLDFGERYLVRYYEKKKRKKIKKYLDYQQKPKKKG
jgi:hypothetical protein